MRFVPLIIIAVFLSACIPTPTPIPTVTASLPYRITPEDNPYAPKLEDAGWQTATVTIMSSSLSERFDLTPPRVVLNLVGYMPSVCNQLRVDVNQPDSQFRIFVNVYSLIDPKTKCDSVFQQFDVSILLGTYSIGRYTLWVNDAEVGDFVSY